MIHVASHSFTPMLDGVPRQADVAWLYDPRRPGEAAFARAWMLALAKLAPDLRLRRNYPYQGRADGLTASLRKHHPDAAYVGIELEVNQRFVDQGGAAWDRLRTSARRFAEEGACRHCETLRLLRSRRRGDLPLQWRQLVKTLRVPSSHCCVSASK